jgi:large subunit ribosomal protein LP0
MKGSAVFVKGKNTLVRKFIRRTAEHPEWQALLPHLRGNVGLVFAKGDLTEVKKKLLGLRVEAPAKVGIIAPQDVFIQKGPTKLEPTKTSFLQALNIASKINRGTIEILQDVHLIKVGNKVGSSESTLLTMLEKKPFSYGLICNNVYEDGKVYQAKFLDVPPSEVLQRFYAGISTVAAISLATGVPTLASVPHSILNSFKNLVAISLETKYNFEQAKKIKDIVENPDAYKSTQQQTTTVVEQPKVEQTKVEDENPPEDDKKKDDSSGGDMGFSFFDE